MSTTKAPYVYNALSEAKSKLDAKVRALRQERTNLEELVDTQKDALAKLEAQLGAQVSPYLSEHPESLSVFNILEPSLVLGAVARKTGTLQRAVTAAAHDVTGQREETLALAGKRTAQKTLTSNLEADSGEQGRLAEELVVKTRAAFERVGSLDAEIQHRFGKLVDLHRVLPKHADLLGSVSNDILRRPVLQLAHEYANSSFVWRLILRLRHKNPTKSAAIAIATVLREASNTTQSVDAFITQYEAWLREHIAHEEAVAAYDALCTQASVHGMRKTAVAVSLTEANRALRQLGAQEDAAAKKLQALQHVLTSAEAALATHLNDPTAIDTARAELVAARVATMSQERLAELKTELSANKATDPAWLSTMQAIQNRRALIAFFEQQLEQSKTLTQNIDGTSRKLSDSVDKLYRVRNNYSATMRFDVSEFNRGIDSYLASSDRRVLQLRHIREETSRIESDERYREARLRESSSNFALDYLIADTAIDVVTSASWYLPWLMHDVAASSDGLLPEIALNETMLQTFGNAPVVDVSSLWDNAPTIEIGDTDWTNAVSGATASVWDNVTVPDVDFDAVSSVADSISSIASDVGSSVADSAGDVISSLFD